MTSRGARGRSGRSDRPRTAASALPFDSELRELRSSIANLRTLADALQAAMRDRRGRGPELLAAVVEEAERASRAVNALAAVAESAQSGAAADGEMPVARFAAELARRAAAELDLEVEVDKPLAGRLGASPALLAAILAALGRLRRDYGVSAIRLSARDHDQLLALDLAFAAREPESSRLREEHAAVLAAGEPALGEAARSLGGEAWLAIRRGESMFSLRVLLPRISEH